MFIYIINSAMFPVVIVPLKLSSPPIYIVVIVLIPIKSMIRGKNHAPLIRVLIVFPYNFYILHKID